MWLDHYRGLLCDLDGCLVAGGRLLPGARELVAYARNRLIIVSNNSTDTPATLAAKFARLNLPVAPERIVLAGATAVEHLAATVRQARVAIYGAPAIVRYAKSLGLAVDHDRPHFVLLARDRHFSYARLHRLVRQIERGADFIVSNVDVSHPGPDGSRVLETGVLLAAVKACLPGVTYTAIGKPSPLLYEAAMRRISAGQDELLAIGDNPATDQEGARGMALACLLVGADPRAHFRNLAELMQSRRRPRGSEPVRGGRLRRREFHGDPGPGLLQDAKSNLNGRG
jgi:HAD superfamily hydrolase (TIGR01450 family)